MSAKVMSVRSRLVIVCVLVVVAGGITAYMLNLSLPGFGESKVQAKTAAQSARLKVELVKDIPHTLSVPEEVRTSLHILKGGKDNIAVAQPAEGRRPLVLSASTAFDPASSYRIRIRFTPADVVRIPKVAYFSDKGTQERELRPGDEVKAKDLLAELYSVDLGAKKNDLVDALVQLKNDKEILENAETSTAIPRALFVTFEKAVQADISARDRAQRYLEAWKIPKEEIEAVYADADEIFRNKLRRSFAYDRKYDPDAHDKWGKIELRAPFDAVIVERNLSEKETLLDPTVNLFQLAKVDKLLVQANAPEEKVKELYQVWKESGLQWRIRTLGEPNSNGIVAKIDEIGYLADPNQHTIPIKGLIPNGDKVLRAGQYVTATIELPPPKNAVQIPESAVVDDGKQTIIFVQPDPKKAEFTLRRVMVTHRYDNKLLVRSVLSDLERKLTPEEKEAGMLPTEPLAVGERVLAAGVLELKRELEDREADKTPD
jgi:cobalt-zinc-cadmium efflux system membrane fusion protein